MPLIIGIVDGMLKIESILPEIKKIVKVMV
jgi:PII-like signaling protein